MKSVTITGYSFDELDPKIQAGLLQDSIEINVDEWWSETVIESFTQRLENLGILNAKIFFSGFWSQGDGACFTTTTVDTDKLIRHLYESGVKMAEDALLYTGDYSISIQKVDAVFANRYEHENTVEAIVSTATDESSRIDDYLRGHIELLLNDYVRGLCRELYALLEECYIELTSDAAIRQTIIENETLYTISGAVIYID